MPPAGKTIPYGPSNFTYPFPVFSNVVILFVTVFVIVLSLNAKLSNVTEPVPLAVKLRLVLVDVVSITFPLI